MTRRVVVTGVGLLSPLGNSATELIDNLIAGKTGIRQDAAGGLPFPVGRVQVNVHEHFSKLQLLHLDRVSQLSLVAARDAITMAGLPTAMPLGEDTGIFFGTAVGGIASAEQAYSDFFGAAAAAEKHLTVLAAMPHAPASHVALRFGIRGECQTYATACSSSAVAIGEAYRRIKDGYVKRALAGGAECMLTPGVLKSWADMRMLCAEPQHAPGTGFRPFSADRSGFAVGEGAGFLVLETAEGASRRGARVLAEVIGYGVSNDASHISRPNPQGQVLAMRRALEGANLAPVAVGYVNANGTATQAGDVTESNAIKLVFGDHAHQMPVSATKSAHGHMMGAAGVVEFIAALMALRRQCVPPTTHWAQRDPDCDLDYVPGRGRPVARLRYVMSNSFAFGGNNVSLLARTPADLAGQRG